VRIVVPFPSGGAADIFAPLVGQKFADLWGGEQTVIIDNKTGASGIIGSKAAAKSTADGYTLMMVTIGHAVSPFMFHSCLLHAVNPRWFGLHLCWQLANQGV
jgi:tripartite-type tricarboxylate transporter receptor subunit TctC